MKRIVLSFTSALIIAAACFSTITAAEGGEPVDTTPYEPVDTTPALVATTPAPIATTPAPVVTTPPIQQTTPRPVTTLISCNFCGQHPCVCTVQAHTDPTEPPLSTPDEGIMTPAPDDTVSASTTPVYEAIPGDPFGQTDATTATASTSSDNQGGGMGTTGSGGVPPVMLGFMAVLGIGTATATPFIIRAMRLKKIYTY